MPDSFALASFQLQVRVHYADGTSGQLLAATVNNVYRFEVYCLPAGFTQLGLSNLLNPVASWEVWVCNAAGVAQTERRTYVLATDYVARPRYLLSEGNSYRLLSPGTVDYNGASVGDYSLQWAGPQGLYQQWHKPWLDFRARAVPAEYEVPFRIADLLTLDPAGQELVDFHLQLWQKVSLKVSVGSRLRTATFSYQELL
ncbi:hypothetical protein [Hymenobacter convexus]|uniref:hypothetical protein n=1 Tax=Hymenobacter sp. CA1UV-4 TaxID=3063782 RepID=UPI0027143298|nr:hypothetical protein [Hymenobacter sp. CA1UV-4]MDO7852305.1 hypothetical protein [Hymenobacter sp. CA1UV-4]